MKERKMSVARQAVALILCIVLMIGIVPLGILAEGTAEYATVKTYTGGTITGNNTANVVVEINEVTLQKTVERDGWFVGIDVIAPADADLAAAKFTVSSDGGNTFGAEKSFDEFKDGPNDIQLWFSLNPESLRKCMNEGKSMSRIYRFDWNGDGSKIQNILFKLVPSKKIVLMEGETQVFPDKNYGFVTTFTGGAIANNNTEKVTVSVTKTTLNWVPANSLRAEGWWVGINMIAPEGMDLSNASYKVNNGSGFGAPKSFAEYCDTPNSIQLWFPISPDSIERFRSSGRDMVMLYEFNWNGKGDQNQIIEFAVRNPYDGIVLKKDGVQVYPVPCGTVETFTGGTITGNTTQNVSVVIKKAELHWVPGNDLRPEGWWVGINVIAPDNVDLTKSKFWVSRDGGENFEGEKSFEDLKDTDNSIQLWFSVSPESLSEYMKQEKSIGRAYRFDWTGNGDDVQDILFELVPSANIVLHRDGKIIFPLTVTFEDNGNGSFSPGGTLFVEMGRDLAFKFTPDGSKEVNGYKTFVYDNDVRLNKQDLYTIGNIQESHTIKAMLEDVQEPMIDNVFERVDGETVTYTFTVTDNSGTVASVVDQDNKDIVSENGTYTLSGEKNGEYTVTAKDETGNSKTRSLTSQAPAVAVIVPDGFTKEETLTFTLKVGDGELSEEDIKVTCDNEASVTPNGDGTYDITVKNNGEYTVTVAKDKAWEITTVVTINKFDWDKPEIESVSVSKEGWTNHEVKITCAANDNGVSGVREVKYLDLNGEESTATYDAQNGQYVIKIPAAETEDLSKITVWAVDNAGNESDQVESQEFGFDLTAPKVTVSYNNNEVENDRYFKDPRTATIVVEEKNFGSANVKVNENDVHVNWTQNADGNHVGRVTFDKDGAYQIQVSATDAAGNTSGGAKYQGKAPTEFVIDTTYEDMITCTGVANGMAYGYDDSVIPDIKIQDVNLDSYSISLVGVQKDKVTDLTETAESLLKVEKNKVTGVLDVFEAIREKDGIYTLTLTAKDKAGNEDQEEIVFTVNRFGSVYYYDVYLRDLIADGGQHVRSVDQDLIIMEYNADKLLEGSLDIQITVDGRPLDNVKFTASPEINDKVEVGNSGWYQYKYTISKENFTADGVYKIAISSKDATGNAPETSNFENMEMIFHVDSTKPEISSVVGLETPIINATEVAVKYTVFDTMGIKSVKVYVDDELVQEITDFSMDLNNYNGTFSLREKSDAQTVRIVVEDLAGNITDTDADDFSSAFVFNKAVTVSTNIFVRWYANKALFWGSIGGTAVLVAAVWLVIMFMRKKKNKE